MNSWRGLQSCFRGVSPELLLTIFLASGFLNCGAATLTPTQVLDYTRAGDLHLSPDGKKLAYIVVSYPLDWLPRIRIMDIATGNIQEITPAKKSDRSPQWSPDRKTLAFLSNRSGRVQVYMMPADGGEATALTSAKNGVSAYHWSPDGMSIAYSAKDDDAPGDDDSPQLADDERKLLPNSGSSTWSQRERRASERPATISTSSSGRTRSIF